MNERRLAFIDVETTGLNDRKHEILEVAVLITDPQAYAIQQTMVAKLQPQHLELAEPKALEVNGYNPIDWAPHHCWTRPSLLGALSSLLENKVLVGQNVAFDEGFLKSFFYEFDRTPTWHHHKVDTASLAWPDYARGRIKGISLSALAEHFGMHQPQPHTALSDATIALNLYRHFVRPSPLRRVANLFSLS